MSRTAPSVNVRRVRWSCSLLLLCWLGGNGIGQAAPPNASSTSRAVRAAAIRAIPFQRLDAEARAKAASVVNQTTIFRRLPIQIVDCDPNYFVFLVRHPEVIVNIWQKMDATDMTLVRQGPESFNAEDGAGTTGQLEFLYGDQDTHILYADGSYTGPLAARPIRAQCLLILKSEYVKHENGRQYVANRLDMFLNVQNVGIDLLAKTFQNLIGNATDQNFIETANFVTKLSRTTQRNGPGVQRLAAQLTGLQPDVREAFAQQATAVYEKAVEPQVADGADQRPTVVARAPKQD